MGHRLRATLWLFRLLLLLLFPPPERRIFTFTCFSSVPCGKCVLFSQPHWGTGDQKTCCVSVSFMSPIPWRPQALTTIPYCWAFTPCSHFTPMTHPCSPSCMSGLIIIYFCRATPLGILKLITYCILSFFFQLLTLRMRRRPISEGHLCKKKAFRLCGWIFNCRIYVYKHGCEVMEHMMSLMLLTVMQELPLQLGSAQGFLLLTSVYVPSSLQLRGFGLWVLRSFLRQVIVIDAVHQLLLTN